MVRAVRSKTAGKAPRKKKPKDRPLRRSQLISPFGVGAISDFRGDEALMCAGLEEWFAYESDIPAHLRLEESRLQRRLGRGFFVRPPELKGPDEKQRKVPFVRFPLWHYCPQCFRMQKATYFQDQPYCDPCKSGRRRTIPVRIVAACEGGHIEDFPFRQWIRCTCASEAEAKLMFRAGRSSAGLGGIFISCEACGKTRSLSGAMSADTLRNAGCSCQGGRPWFAEEVTSCGRDVQGVQRGGSNVYFPVVVSSIYVPDEQAGIDERILTILDNPDVWDILSSAVEDGRIDPTRCEVVAAMKKVDAARLLILAQRKLDGQTSVDDGPLTEEQYRQQEYALLRTSLTNPGAELVTDWLDGQQFGDFGRYIKGVGLVRKLRETRVLCGFSRLKPLANPDDGDVQPISCTAGVNWLPGIDVYGEGIFIEFDRDQLEAWATSPAVAARLQAPLQRFERIRLQRGQHPFGAHPRFVFLHSFAHALIKELTFTCGSGSSSLPERLYVDVENPQSPMAGVLIYTASGDADGTLGGLVAQGAPNRLPRIVVEALRRSTWCSNDPVCMEGAGRQPDTGNLAACHSCELVPETSCEQGNRLLDRATLVGAVGDPAVGFLSALTPGASDAQATLSLAV